MAAMDRSDIPSGLNRIKTRRVPPEDSSGGDDSPAPAFARSDVAPSNDAAGLKTSEDRRRTGAGSQRAGNSKGFRRGKKIARWFTSYLSVNDSRNMSANSPDNENYKTESKAPSKSLSNRKQFTDLKEVAAQKPTFESISVGKMENGKKSFSHELGPRGGICSSQPRLHSYDDLKELLGSFHSKCHASKQVVNAELADFASDLVEIIEKTPFSEAKCKIEDLLLLARNCKEMSCNEFRKKCEGIVQELMDQRLLCGEDFLRQILTRMLFILTRCTRLLQFQKDGGAINEDSLHKFRLCLDSIPVVELGWPLKSGKIEDTISDKDEIQRNYNQLKGYLPGKDLIKPVSFSHQRKEESSELDSVICRICEEYVPTSNLESHSYICAYADKCDLDGTDVDDRLAKIAEILEQIFESYTQKVDASFEVPDLANGSSNRSSKVLEWHNKGLQGMFEDLHEMDTAFLDESHLSCFSNTKNNLGTKVASSNGSMTPVSSTSTPRANYFDFFWLEHTNTSHLEDANQINRLAEIARRIEDLDFKSNGALEVSEACMRDLENVLNHSKVKALIVDSFGNRLMNLLREKHLAALVHGDLNSCFDESVPSEDSSLQSANSTPHSTYKERTSIDDFEIIKPISRGAFGEVFLARKRTTGDLFAIKVLKRLHMIRKNDIERILAERNILITVRNPFVVRFFYSFTCRDNLYLVMEYLNGGDLYSLLRKIGCLEEDVARIYIAELVLALEYLHSLGIVHRDLKPDNILIARDGHIKLTDFGLSKIGLINKAVDFSGSESNSSILLDPEQSRDFSEYALKEEDKENRNSAVGTPDYLAPEILLGTEHGYAADWWSVGIILFELITGIPPFTAELPERIFENILNMKIPWPEVPDEMSCEAKDLIERLLVLEPHQRLGATGASEVKAHPFFNKVDWDNLVLQKAAFVPNPESADDTSYFLSRYSSISLPTLGDQNFSDCLSVMTELSSHQDNEITEVDQQSEWRDIPSSSYVDISEINFSFKNLSQLASMNYDVLLQSGRLSKCSSPVKGPSLTSQP